MIGSSDEESSLVGVSMGAMGGEDDPFADDDAPALDIAIEKKVSAKMAAAPIIAPLEVPQDGPLADPSAPPVPAKPKEPTPAEILAGYGESPKQPWNWPIYAVRVLKRQHELRTELVALRERRSPEVALYEQAMKAYDANVFARGAVMIAITMMMFVLAFFSPVLVRFWRLAMDS